MNGNAVLQFNLDLYANFEVLIFVNVLLMHEAATGGNFCSTVMSSHSSIYDPPAAAQPNNNLSKWYKNIFIHYLFKRENWRECCKNLYQMVNKFSFFRNLPNNLSNCATIDYIFSKRCLKFLDEWP